MMGATVFYHSKIPVKVLELGLKDMCLIAENNELSFLNSEGQKEAVIRFENNSLEIMIKVLESMRGN